MNMSKLIIQIRIVYQYLGALMKEHNASDPNSAPLFMVTIPPIYWVINDSPMWLTMRRTSTANVNLWDNQTPSSPWNQYGGVALGRPTLFWNHCHLSPLPLPLVNCQNMADVRNVKQNQAFPMATLPGIPLEASVPVTYCWCDWKRRNGRLPGQAKCQLMKCFGFCTRLQ